LWVRGCKQPGSLGGVSFAFIHAGGPSGIGARCIVVCGAPHGVPIDFVVRLARPSAAGRWPFPRPAVVLAGPVSRGLTFADRTDGGHRGFRPGFATPPGLRPGQMTSSTRGPAWRVPGPVASPASCPKAGRRMCSVQGIVDSLTSPHLPEGRGADPLPGTCGGVLPDSSHGLLKDAPPSTSAVCVHSRRMTCSCSPRTGSTRPRPAGEQGACSDPWALAHRPSRHSPSVRACHGSNPGPLLPFLTTSAACSTHAVQVCCALQPIMGFAWFQSRVDPLLLPLSRGCPRASRRPTLSPSLETDRRGHDHREVVEIGRIRCSRRPGDQGSSRRSVLTPGGVREVSCPALVLANHGHRVVPPTFAPATFPSPREVGPVPPAFVLHTCRAIPTGATPFGAFPSRTARSGSRVSGPDAPSSLRVVAPRVPRMMKSRRGGVPRSVDLEAFVHA
jgi:hypothetical protein